ncbi:hypothetical protein EV141_0176 [Microcella putealis]|uniref:HTH cro/C1-type domain-containing protein n=1 Tax=Microcella putealis TaxID=337005 RepID=A0A4Q7LWM5_9MICO|nr:helix-turn-helix transcriptional regulator [Microcella putealis]RZS58963.1 hypothetical protein EV141_0176 [Microcella putealis]TQM23989.1 hypothetical protein BJ957_1455 [Microcella putealis]
MTLSAEIVKRGALLARYAHVVTTFEPGRDIRMTDAEIEQRRRLDDWERHERAFAKFVLENVKAVKNRKGYTAAQLAARMSTAGWPLSVSSLNGMLGKKKRATITITEVFAFAAALEVPPVELLFPTSSSAYDQGRGVTISPGFTTSPEAALDWFTGDTTHDDRDRLLRAAILEAREDLRASIAKIEAIEAGRRLPATAKSEDDG